MCIEAVFLWDVVLTQTGVSCSHRRLLLELIQEVVSWECMAEN